MELPQKLKNVGVGSMTPSMADVRNKLPKFAMLLIGIFCAGCATTSASLSSLQPVCAALVGPIRYNSAKQSSDRYAGKALVPDLAQRNHIGVNLGCPAYKR
jgi:hypothetical protein